MRTENPELQSKEVISIVARLWAEVPDDEKRVWKERAKTAAASLPSAIHAENNDDEDDENGEGDEEEEGEEEDGHESDSGKDEAELSLLETGGASSAFDNESPADEDRGELFNVRQYSNRRRRR